MTGRWLRAPVTALTRAAVFAAMVVVLGLMHAALGLMRLWRWAGGWNVWGDEQ